VKRLINGSALCKKYSAKAIQQRCHQEDLFVQKPALEGKEIKQISQLNPIRKEDAPAFSKGVKNAEGIIKISEIGKPLDKLTQPEKPSELLPYQLKRKKKKKRRKKETPNNQ
jgi:hypothetical protein